jgi:hypothetical protein
MSAEFVNVQFRERAGTVLLPNGQILLVTLQSRLKEKILGSIKPGSVSKCRGSRGFPTAQKVHIGQHVLDGHGQVPHSKGRLFINRDLGQLSRRNSMPVLGFGTLQIEDVSRFAASSVKMRSCDST